MKHEFFQTMILIVGVLLIITNCMVVISIDIFLKKFRDMFFYGAKEEDYEVILPEQTVTKKFPEKTLPCGHVEGSYHETDSYGNKYERCITCRTLIKK